MNQTYLNNSGTKIKIKSLTNNNENKKLLLDICSKSRVRVSRVTQVKDGFLVHCRSLLDSDALFQPAAVKVLNDRNFNPITPMELKAKRSIIILNADDIIYNHDEEAIKAEIIAKNKWAEITDIYKFGNSKTLKIMFSSYKIRG